MKIPATKDFSTNYCNLRMLYCGSHEGCKPVQKDFAIEETSASPSWGASKNPDDCLQTASAQAAQSAEFLAPQPLAAAQCPPAGFETAPRHMQNAFRCLCCGLLGASSSAQVKDFDLEAFIAKRWYIQQQMETRRGTGSRGWLVCCCHGELPAFVSQIRRKYHYQRFRTSTYAIRCSLAGDQVLAEVTVPWQQLATASCSVPCLFAAVGDLVQSFTVAVSATDGKTVGKGV